MSTEAIRYNTLEVDETEVITSDRFVKLSATGKAENCDTAGESAIGIAVDSSTNKSSRAITVVDLQGGGVAEVAVGGAVAIGDNLATDGDGKAVEATTGQRILGVAKSAGAAAGDIIQIILGYTGRVA